MALELPKGPLTVIGLQADNFKRLKVAHLTPSATGLIPVRGKNAQGKSSLIDAMAAALCGTRGAAAEPITRGEHGAQVILDLGEIVVRRRWTRDSGSAAKTKLTVEWKDGGLLKSPQTILDMLTGEFADPVAFRDMKSEDQVKTVLAITGLDRKLSQLEAVETEWFDKRIDLNREMKRTADASDQLNADVPPAPEVEPAPLEELTAWLESTIAQNQKRTNAAKSMEDNLNAAQGAEERVASIALKIKALQQDLLKEKEWISTCGSQYVRAQELFDSIEEGDLDPINEAIATVESHREGAMKRKLAHDAKTEAIAAGLAYEAADGKVNDAREAITGLLAEAEFPVPGMSYDPVGKTIMLARSLPSDMSDVEREAHIEAHGLPPAVPFKQASQAEQLQSAAGVAMAGDPAIRIMFAREGSLLDGESKLILAKAAEAAGFQFWLEVVDDTREGAGVWIDDGEAFENETVYAS